MTLRTLAARLFTKSLAALLAALLGWFLLVWAAVDIVGPIAWKVGTALVLLGVLGFRLFGYTLWTGLYMLDREGKQSDEH